MLENVPPRQRQQLDLAARVGALASTYYYQYHTFSISIHRAHE